MIFVLVIAVIVVAGWIFMSVTASDGRPRNPDAGSDDSVPVNAYDNPYDTNENNDRPFEPDAGDDGSDACVADDSGGGDSSD